MPELLLELGCEELPATFVEKAYSDLRDKLVASLSESGVLPAGAQSTAMGTPRRLIVSVDGILERQSDEEKEMRGPAIKAAFDDAGNPTPALLGFCKSNGVDASTVRKDDKYVWVTKKISGKATSELLAELVPAAIKSLSFDKTMRWGSARMRFARPIRWIVCAFDNQPVHFVIETVQSTIASCGHRFYSPDLFEAHNLKDLLSGLRDRFVEPDPEIRRELIRTTATKVASGSPLLTESLVDENAFLTEWPAAIEGEFKEEFLDLPRPVLITAMAKHEKMFPVQAPDGKLTNKFVFIRNSGEEDTVRIGSQWVLNARFNDARFFYSEDQKHGLEVFLERCSTIVFQEKLGNVRQRSDRLSQLSEAIAVVTGGDKDEQVLARTAGMYCKADLSTGLVSELPSLQGVVGSEYARRQGMLEDVAWAIGSHYDLAKNPNINSGGSRTAIRVTMADQLDKLSGYLGLGLEPSGSSDPYGLRRAVTMLIEAAIMWDRPIPAYIDLLQKSIALYSQQSVELDSEKASASLVRMFAARYETLLADVRHDILEAALIDPNSGETTMPRRIRMRIKCLNELDKATRFVQTATRPINIIASARKKEIPFLTDNGLAELDPEALQSPSGLELLQAMRIREEELRKAVVDERAEDVCSLLRALEKPINEFFDQTMVMAEEEHVRFARLSLMQACASQLLCAGDFSKLVVAGGQSEE